MTVISSLVAVFVPILPIIPPGLLLTFVYRRLMWHSQKTRAYRDLARLPLRYLRQGTDNRILSTGEKYGFLKVNSLPTSEISSLVPGALREDKKQELYFFGVLDENEKMPVKSIDPFVSFGILPANLVLHSYRYAIRTCALEVLAWIFLALGIIFNVIFIMIILLMLGAY
jgi:hypothetical protein